MDPLRDTGQGGVTISTADTQLVKRVNTLILVNIVPHWDIYGCSGPNLGNKIISSVGILALPFRPLYCKMSLLSFPLF